jgi:uncharacterized lipoprotein YajG
MKLILASIVIAMLTGCAGQRPTIYMGPPSNSYNNSSVTCSGTGAMKTCHHSNGQVTQCFNNGATITCNTF